MLVGRDAEIQAFRRGLANGSGDPARAMLLLGARGTGKTVLLNALEDIAREAGWSVVSDSAHPGLVEELTDTVMPELLAALNLRTVTRRVTGVSASVLGVGGSISSAVDEDYPIKASFRSTLTTLALALDRQDSGVLLSIDEVHRAEQGELRQFFHAVQHAFREGLPVAVVAAGLPSAVSDLLNDDVLTFLRRAQRWSLREVPDAFVRSALRDPIVAAGRVVTEDALAVAVPAVRGYPFMIQIVGYELWATAPEVEVIDADQAAVAIPRAFVQVSQLVVEPELADLTAPDRRFLAAMADEEPGPVSILAIKQRMGVTPSYANKYRARLIAAEILEPAGRGRVRFAVPFLREYLRHDG